MVYIQGYCIVKDMVSFLRMYATGQSGVLNSYLDGAKVSSYAKTAMEWAVTNGIMSGKTSSVAGKYNLDPQGDATRAECAAMIRKLNEDFLNQ